MAADTRRDRERRRMPAASRFELFDHTADLGVRVTAPTLAELVRPAAQGLYAVIGELASTDDTEPLELTFAGDEPSLLLRDYVSELLHLLERGRRVLVAIDRCEFDQRRLVVTGRTRALDEKRSIFHHEVKAVTYHELAIRQGPAGYEATYIVDI
jgi:SHS2 domain-containing protein